MRTTASRHIRTSFLQIFALSLIVFIVVQYGSHLVQLGSNVFFGGEDGSELKQSPAEDSAVVPPRNRAEDRYSTFVTAKGMMSVEGVERNVFHYYGYSLLDNTQVIPVIGQEVQLTCEEVFQEWLGSAKSSSVAAKFEPTNFTLNSYAFLEKRHYDQPPKSKPLIWTRTLIERIAKEVQEDHKRSYTYWDGWTVFAAMKHVGVAGLRGAVIGSQSPWVEAYCLVNGAKHITTVDYQEIKIEHPQMDFLSVTISLYESFDFIVTFSSLEHSGLGRYGDPLDPFGDVKEMRKLRCLLKPGGMLYLGLPTGLDTVVFNAHRIYGRLRLPFMMEGLELINVFHDNELP
ncbi:Protein K06H6.1, partial [Aphelenchoides avenae]